MSLIGGLSLARLLHHLDKHFSGLRRIRNFSQEGNAGSMHAILGFQADVKAEAIKRGHLRLLCLDASKPLREQDERILMVGIHVLHDVALVLNQRIGLCLGVLRGSYPSHHSEAAHVIHVQYILSVKEEILEIDPVLAVWITRQVYRTRGSQLWLRYSDNTPYQRDSGRTERVTAGVRLGQKQAGARVCLQILRMHGHRADQENWAPLVVQRIRHQ